MTARIDAIDSGGRGARARVVRFDDGSERRTTGAAVKALNLELGSSVTPDELDRALAEVEAQVARDRALRLLGYRERSVRELTGRLEDEGLPIEVVAEVIESLQGSGLLDDARFAEHLVHTRVSAGYGRARILRELTQHGFDREAACRVLARSEEELGQTDVERLELLLRERPIAGRRDRERILRRYVSKGFEPQTVLEALRTVGEGF